MPDLLRTPPAVDVPACVETMAAAFAGDPLYRWLHPDRAGRERAMRATFTLVLRAGLARGRVDADPAGTAVAVWTPPGAELLDEAGREDFLAILRLDAAPRMADALAGMAALEAHRPAAAHWALHSVAVAPAAQGAGAGTRLLRAGLARADADGVAAHLDSSSARNVPFYERLGFAVVAEEPVPGGGPVMRAMVRPPAGR
jgi:ribosomal protein S18 acetylase RimI-like enzyme